MAECRGQIGNVSLAFSLGLHVGAIGVGAEADLDDGRFKFTPPSYGICSSYSIDIDIK